MDRDYVCRFKAWTNILTESQLQVLKSAGVSKPSVSYSGKGAPNQDIADSPAASYEPDFAALIDGEPESEPEHPGGRDVAEFLRHFVAFLISRSNMRLTVDCLALVIGLRDCNEASMTTIAKRHGISPAAVSDRCVQITKDLRIPPSRTMRSFLARQAAKEAQLKKNRKNEP